MIRCSMLLAAAALATLGGPTADAQPANDGFGSALVIPGLPFTDTRDTTTATTAPDDPSCAGQGTTVWYRFTPAQDVRVEANTAGSAYDTTLSVYTGEQGSLNQIACNDDAIGLQSRVRFDAAAGETYFIMAGAYFDSPGGGLVLTVDVGPPPLRVDVSLDPFGTFVPQTGTAVIRGTVTCSQPVTAEIAGDAVQRAGRLKIQGFYFTAVENCGVSTPWQAEVVDPNARFAGGTVLASASAFAFSDEGATDSAARRVTLRGR